MKCLTSKHAPLGRSHPRGLAEKNRRLPLVRTGVRINRIAPAPEHGIYSGISLVEVLKMVTAKLFSAGRSQAVRLPKAFRFDGGEVLMEKIGTAVVLFSKDAQWDMFLSDWPDSAMLSWRTVAGRRCRRRGPVSDVYARREHLHLRHQMQQ
jgi:virulence-associated protein VagC